MIQTLTECRKARVLYALAPHRARQALRVLMRMPATAGIPSAGAFPRDLSARSQSYVLGVGGYVTSACLTPRLRSDPGHRRDEVAACMHALPAICQ